MNQVNEWAVPFLAKLESGQNSFSVDVPVHFCYNTLTAVPNKLYFSKLDVVPDFYSIQAEQLDLDSVSEENMILNFPVSIVVVYGSAYMDPKFPLTNRPTYKYVTSDRGKENIISGILDFLSPTNPYFAKTTFQKFPALYWDWFDLGSEEHQTPEEFIKDKIFNPAVEMYYYGTRGAIQTQHLRSDLVTVDNYKSFPTGIVNPFIFPKNKAHVDKTLRIRLFLQPKTSLHFSNAGMLIMLGFDVNNHPHISTVGKQTVIANNSATEWLELEADTFPSWTHWELPDGKLPSGDTKLQLKTSEMFAPSRLHSQPEKIEYTLSMTKTDYDNAGLVRVALGKLIDKMTNQNNINVTFNVQSGELGVPDPSTSQNMVQSIVFNFPNINLANKLSYKQLEIYHDTQQQGTLPGPATKLNFEQKAKSLVFDTNLIYVLALDTISSDRMHPFAPGFVASLHPEDGTMTMDIPWSKQPDYFRLAEYQTGQNHIPLTFDLYTILPNKQHIKLNWKPGATICGILRSTL